MNNQRVQIVGVFMVLLFVAFSSFSQNLRYSTIGWDTASVKLAVYQAQKDSLDAVRLRDECVYEYVFEESATVLYYTIHRKVLVLTDRGIEAFNRVYIAGNKSDLVNVKVRTVSAAGTVKELDKTNIKEVENLDNKGAFKIFAVEGVERNSIVEMIYTMRKPAGITGRYVFQDEFPARNAVFELRTPVSLVFETKAYNASFVYTDTVLGDVRIQRFEADSIAPLLEEKYCTYDANLARVDYTFSRNTEGGEVQNNWLQVIHNYSEAFYSENPEADKLINKQLKKLKIAKLSDDKLKIQTIENYIKSQFVIKDLRGVAEVEDLVFVMKNKFSNEDGITHLFVRFLELAGVDHRLGITCDRNDARFDRDFVSWHNLSEYVVYFPSIDMYLSPTSTALRLGMLPTGFTHNYGVFIKKIGIGSYKSEQPEIRFIPALSMEKSKTIQNISLQVDTLNKAALVDYRYEVTGNEASYIKPYYDFLPQESRDAMLDNILRLMGKDTKVLSKKIEGTNHEHSLIDEPLTLNCSLQIPSLIEQAGNSFLINIGNVIGEQVEMYSNKKRRNLIELDYMHCYNRKIEVNVPQGYTAKGLDDIVINKEFGDGTNKTMGFVSNYKVQGNKILIDVYEYYNSITYPVEQYEQFRAVINAAADFNKKIIVLERN